VPDEYQALGYPILTIRSIPKDPKWLARFFKDDLDRAFITTPLSVQDVWPENYSTNSVQKVWAAKFAARHPNIVVLDLSSFKCGHDAPTYGLIDNIINSSGTPASALHDIDANKPGGSIKIRVKTYAHGAQVDSRRSFATPPHSGAAARRVVPRRSCCRRGARSSGRTPWPILEPGARSTCSSPLRVIPVTRTPLCRRL
jgi:predicted nucleotide-binding protein (sugar kinase/HSP70/actin superfamily)